MGEGLTRKANRPFFEAKRHDAVNRREERLGTGGEMRRVQFGLDRAKRFGDEFDQCALLVAMPVRDRRIGKRSQVEQREPQGSMLAGKIEIGKCQRFQTLARVRPRRRSIAPPARPVSRH